MRKKRRLVSLAVTLALFLALSMPASAVNLYFTGINDSVAMLTSDTMPFWSGGTLYVPYTVFDANQNGIGVSLGLYTNYNRNNNTVALFSQRQLLIYDLNTGTCRDDLTGMTYPSQALMRNGRPYVALGTVCTVFGLDYSYNQLSYIPQGYLVRIKSADVVLDDIRFMDVAKDLINNRLRDYTKSLSSAESTAPEVQNPPAPVVPTVPSDPTPPENDTDIPTYLAFRCEDGGALRGILDGLDSSRCYGVFFLSPQVLEEEGSLVRQILGTGHSVGILADGEGELEELLARGNQALERAAHARTTLAYVPAGQRAALEQEGWVCWNETLALTPGDSVGAAAFASNAMSRLGTRYRTVYLTLEGGAATARVLPTLLRQMNSNHYILSVPLETRL